MHASVFFTIFFCILMTVCLFVGEGYFAMLSSLAAVISAMFGAWSND